LKKVWDEVDAKAKRVRAPACLYQEADVVVRTLRDLGAGELSAIVIDQERLYDEARAFAQVFMPEISNRIQLHREELPLFSYYGLEERLASLFERKVPLPSGGTIVIEQTEALVSIDVNSSRNRAAGDVETTAMMVNLEAVSTIAEQLVLRDLGGLIIIDFIDMENREHQKLVQLALRRALAGDKAKIQVSPLSRFGLVEMTRQRTRPSHKMLASAECPYCIGTGSIKTAETFEIDCMRAVRESLTSRGLSRLEVVVPHDMAIGMLNARHKELTDLEERHDCRIVFTGDSLMKAREFRLIPTARKGERQTRGAREQPIRPSLLAPLMVERAKALQLARELAAMKPADLERELEEGEIRSAPPVHQPVVEREGQGAAMAAAPRGPATIFDEAIVLRRLLFSPVQPVTVADGAAGNGPSGNGQGPRGGSHGNGQADRPRELAPSRGSANVSRRRSGGRGRRR
ncbi:MAG: ribonuclease E/G, partial [Planctomycetes bacterium]|nr:ribonuclease E/G [Planctomycetota bacterium]